MNRKLPLVPILVFALLGLTPSQSAARVLAVSSGDEPAYVLGTKAMNDQRWSDAVLSFDQVIHAKSKKADAAFYWKAYSLNKLGKQQLAADTCDQLRTQFKDSSWNEDCRVLGLSLSTAQDHSADLSHSQSLQLKVNGSQKDPDAEIKILALNSLMLRDPARAIPLLRGILTGNQSDEFKQKALLILAQNSLQAADDMMRDVVMGKMGLDLQRSAIRDCGIYQSKRLDDALADAYRTSTDEKVKRTVIAALFTSGDDTRLVDLARQEKDLALKRTIVSQISLMSGKAGTDYMMELLK
jgi:hypothetical protein